MIPYITSVITLTTIVFLLYPRIFNYNPLLIVLGVILNAAIMFLLDIPVAVATKWLQWRRLRRKYDCVRQ